MQGPRGGECSEEADEGTEAGQEDEEAEGRHFARGARLRVSCTRLPESVEEVQGGSERQPAVHDWHRRAPQGLQRDSCRGRWVFVAS